MSTSNSGKTATEVLDGGNDSGGTGRSHHVRGRTGRRTEAPAAAADDDEPGDADHRPGWLALHRRGLADDRRLAQGSARYVPRQGARLRPDLAAALPAPDARALPHSVTHLLRPGLP